MLKIVSKIGYMKRKSKELLREPIRCTNLIHTVLIADPQKNYRTNKISMMYVNIGTNTYEWVAAYPQLLEVY